MNLPMDGYKKASNHSKLFSKYSELLLKMFDWLNFKSITNCELATRLALKTTSMYMYMYVRTVLRAPKCENKPS